MIDPLSIAAATATAAQLCFKLSVTVRSFATGVRGIDDNIRSLQARLDSLDQFLRAVNHAWTNNPGVAAV